MLEERFIQLIAGEAGVRTEQVQRVVELLGGGATIPFIARYRKDATGNLDEEKLEIISDRRDYYASLADRRASILSTLMKQEQLTDDLRQAIENCTDKTMLEDLYLPYKKAKRTKATVAREKGLAPLADFIWAQEPSGQTVEEFAAAFVRPEKAVNSLEEAVEGACHILAEIVSTDLEARRLVRERMLKQGAITAHPTKNCEGKVTKFESYYQFSEPVEKIPSHRYLAVHRGVREGFLRMELAVDDASLIAELVTRWLKSPEGPFASHIRTIVEDAYNRLLRPSIENEVIAVVADRADEEAIRVFRENARNLLLSAPAGPISVIGVDPGMKTGCKLAVVDSTGAFIESATIFPSPPQNDVEGAEAVLLALMAKYNVQAIAIGNGTGSREVSRFVKQTLAKIPVTGAFWVFVNEAGASIYSASKLAREEFPHLDVTIRGAISIARRLQDPLAELVKIEPRHIGVGQYQHDVNQRALREGLHRSVVSCVNAVGVELNTASVQLLRYVSGVHADIAKSVVEWRMQHGGFKNRQQLLEVSGVGPKVFEQCAGFLRVAAGDNALDSTAIHPEAYPVVERIAESLGLTPQALVDKPECLDGVDLSAFVTESIGRLALGDIHNELLKRGRDPRTEFKIPKFLEGVDSVQDLEEGMEIEGVVTNVTDFGAFVDIGVHQDGLVHLSELANRFVQDPRDVVKVGEIVKVKVIKVDKALPRISLSIKALLPPPEPRHAHPHPRRHRPATGDPRNAAQAPAAGEGVEPRPGMDQRPPRRDRPQRRDPGQGGGDSRPQRPRPDQRAAGQGEGDRRSQGPRPRRRDRDQDAALRGAVRSGGKQHQPSGDKSRTFGDGGGLLNTQLADQLAALKNKLGG